MYTSSELQQLIGIALVQVLKPWIKDGNTNPLLSLAISILMNIAIAYATR